MLQFLPLALSLASKIPAVQRLLDKVPDQVKEAAASVIVQEVSNATHIPKEKLSTAAFTETALVELNSLVERNSTLLSERALELYHQQQEEARTMYSSGGSKELSDKIALHIIYFNVAYIGVLVVLLFVAIWALGDKPELLAMVSTLIGGIISSLQSERKDIMSFYYASMEGVERLLGIKK